MKKLILALLIVLAVVQAASFQRPWENRSWVAQNPNIWSQGVELWWNLPELDQTLASLDLEHASDIHANGSAKDYLDEAVSSRQAAKNDMQQCMSVDIINPLWVLLGPIGMAVGIVESALAEFSDTASCLQYRAGWIGTADASLDALEQSIADSQRSIEDAEAAYDDIRFMGLCDSNYTGPGSGHCAEMSGAFASVENNVTEGEYGKYPLLLNYSRRFSDELARPEPDLSLFGTMMALVWNEGGVIRSFDSLAAEARGDASVAESEFIILQNSASGRKSMAEAGLRELESEKLDLVSKSPSATGAGQTGAVSERFTALKGMEEQLSEAFVEAGLVRTRVNKQSYLSSAIAQMEDVGEGYAGLNSNALSLMDDARQAESEQRTEADAELAQTEAFIESGARSSESVSLYWQASASFDAGERAATIGDRFSAYARAAALARASRSERTYEEELAVQASLRQLEQLIDSAERDEINVIAEKESLALLEGLSSYEVESYVQSAIDSIIDKARVKYEDDLLDARARITDKLSLAGPAAADLYTDLAGYESGTVSGDGTIDYLSGIGRLKQLKENYALLEATLDGYMSTIIGNGMSVSADPLIENVRLDEPAGITLGAVLANDRDYDAGNVSAKITMRSPMQFFYSDLSEGRGDVESLRMADGGRSVVLVFGHVGPFEAKRILLEKSAVIAHTLSRDTHADGIGNDAAHVVDELEFELDSDISRLALPPGFEGALIDGASAGRGLSAGRHTLASDRIVDDAYVETISSIRAYPVGTNSRVEYDVEIRPVMDLDSVLVFIDAVNDSRISSLDAVAVTGQAVTDKRRISETEYTAKMLNLDANATAVLKVSYNVENTQSVVEDQLDQLDSANLSTDARDLLDQARTQADAGNYTRALELLEQAKALSREQAKETLKLQKKYDELNKKARDELDEITAALSAANASGTRGPLIDALSARKTELERVLREAEGANLSGKVDALQRLDYSWLDKELTSFKKDAYKEYNSLKERFFVAGNSSTPQEFLGFEAALNRLETGGRLEYAVQALEALGDVRLLVSAQESSHAGDGALLRSAFDSLESAVRDTLDRYAKESSSAKGTEYSSLFTESSSSVEKKIKDAESALSSDSRVFWLRMSDLNKSMQRMQSTLDSLKKESEAKLSLLESLIGGSDLDSDKKSGLEQKLQIMRGMVSAGEYVNALRAGSAIAKELESLSKPDNSLLILAITAVAVLATIAVYIIKQQKEGGKEKKKLRKLEKIGKEKPERPAIPEAD